MLIANRGEIAVRIIRTCRELGITSIAVYSDADRAALHVREADEAVPIGPAPAAQSYLNADAIVEAARRGDAGALHPGYGFLSENPALAEACERAGLVFVGPPAAAMRLLGDKAPARRLATAHGVPVLPGYEGEDQEIETLANAARAIGFPMMIKAAAGGGGRGMRLVRDLRDFPAAVESARREALAAFGDGRLLLERAIIAPRHVEVQVIADQHGNLVTLGERDCSIQRRHQKVVEETPSPAVDAALRQRLSEAAATVARAAGYVSAGTVEFLLDRDGSFYFLEVNARLQVEHPVTEMVAGVDLVADQIRVAVGLELPYRQDEVELRGNAIECRLLAEDPSRDYRPSTGRIASLELPHGEGVRADTGIAEGDEISAHYDPMIAKIIAWGANRAEAAARIQRALDTTHVGGIQTNLPLLRAIAANPEFRWGNVSTDFLPAVVNPAALEPFPPVPALLAAFGVEALGLLAGADPWHAAGPWRVGGGADVRLAFDGHPVQITGRRSPGTAEEWVVQVEGSAHAACICRLGPGSIAVEAGGRRTVFRVQARPQAFILTNGDRGHRFERPAPAFEGTKVTSHHEHGLHAPMPGVVVKIFAEPGQAVRAHQPLVALEAMKMEHAVEAPADGTVAHLHCEVGQQVKEGDLLVELDAGPAAE